MLYFILFLLIFYYTITIITLILKSYYRFVLYFIMINVHTVLIMILFLFLYSVFYILR